MKFIIATNNSKKLVELDRILKPLGIEVVSPKQEGVSLDDVEENGTTFEENSFIKAYAACAKTGLPAIADDSGLCVDFLDGAPGIFSARFGGEGATDKDKNNLILTKLKDADNRNAHYTCVITCVFPNGKSIKAGGMCFGTIAHKPEGDNGFGYDPIFLYKGKSFASVSDEEKDKVSHRGIALRAFEQKLKNYLEGKDVNQ